MLGHVLATLRLNTPGFIMEEKIPTFNTDGVLLFSIEQTFNKKTIVLYIIKTISH